MPWVTHEFLFHKILIYSSNIYKKRYEALPLQSFFMQTWEVLRTIHIVSKPSIPSISRTLHITIQATAAAAKSLQLCPTLCDPIDSSPPDSPVPGILQARRLEWVAISFSNSWKWKVKGKSLSHVQLFVNPWSAAFQAPPSIGFASQEYWSRVPSPSPTIQATIIKQ